MSDKTLSFSALLEPTSGQAGLWSSRALELPEARLVRVADEQGRIVAGLGITSAGVLVPDGIATRSLIATLTVPTGLTSPNDLETQKLVFEREKQSIADRWQRRTFAWTIVSALLGLTVTVAGQTLFAAKKAGIGVPVEQIEVCRNSLRRTVTLSSQPAQSIGMLGQAIRQHDAACDELLVKLMSQGDR